MEEQSDRKHQTQIQRRPGKVPIPLRERWHDLRVHGLPLIVWLLALAAVYVLWTRQVPVPNMVGLARTQQYEVSSPISGRLDQVLVQQYELVNAGQLIASLDMAPHQAALETSKAELAKLTADVDAQMASLQAAAARDLWQMQHDREQALASADADLIADRAAQMRRFEGDEADLQIEILEAELEVADNQLEASRLLVRLERAKKLAAGAAGPESDVEDLQLRMDQALGRVKNFQGLVTGLEGELAAAKQRRQDYLNELEPLNLPEPLPPSLELEPQLAGLRAAIVVQRRRLQELEVVRGQYLLHAPFAGRIESAPAPVGQALLAGEAVVMLVNPLPREVVVYLPEHLPAGVAIGDAFRVSRGLQSGMQANQVVSVDSIVLSELPSVQQLPSRLWGNPQVAEYGKAYLVGPVTQMSLVPGERVFLTPLD
jgi:multidrug resistance efflux pump